MVRKPTFLLFLLLLSACKDPYNIKVAGNTHFLLVAEGNIDNGAAGTTFRLSLTAPVHDSVKRNPAVTGAILYVEGSDRSVYPVPETAPGTYTASLQQLQIGLQYRLRIKTKDGKEYLSDYVYLKKNPPIDSISWSRTERGVTVYANTHDPDNKTLYYRWEFDQVYEFHGAISKYMFETPQTVISRSRPDLIYYCWKYDTATSIYTSTSVKLNSDIIYEYPLIFFPANSEPLAIKYRIHVKQYALGKDAYEFYTALKKNMESLGTIFDPQPSELPTNIHCITDPAEKAVGFITASPVAEKVLFIRSQDLPGWTYLHSCYPMHVGNTRDSLQSAYYDALTPLDKDYNNGGYFMFQTECVDCTVRGTNQRPSFW